MKYVRWALAWALFWIGHAVSGLDCFDVAWLIALWMPIYQRFMAWSSTIQGDGDFGPWHECAQPHRRGSNGNEG